jgi:NAD-dependent deacetylase
MEIINDQEAIRRLKIAHRITVLTGAGISVESGIPPFRGEEGLWTKLSPLELASFEAFYSNPAKVSEWYQHRCNIIEKSVPNPGHLALKELQDIVPDFQLITQNIDGLHQRAGSTDVIELHGNIMENYCVCCNQHYSTSEFDEFFRYNPNHVPHCYCGGLIRPNVVWFGEPIPAEDYKKAYEATIHSEVFIIVGTSAQVTPAADLPRYAKQYNSYLIEINPNQTAISDIVDLSLRGTSGTILPIFVKEYKEILRAE